MGKTAFIKSLVERKIQRYPHLNLYILDTKKRGDFDENDGIMHRSAMSPDAYTTGGHRIVWQPYSDVKEMYSKFFTDILEAGVPSLVVIDEAINMRFGMTIPRGLEILLAQGRLPGISVIGATQQVARCPREMLSQATYIVSFKLINKYDESSMADYLQLSTNKLGLKRHQYWLFDTDNDTTAKLLSHFKDLPDKFI